MTQTLDPAGRKKFAKYVSLNILAMLGSSCYIVADTFFVANGIGKDGLTALNLAIAVFSYDQALGLLIAIGCGTRYAIHAARDEKEEGNRVFTHGVISGIAVGLLLALIGNLFCGQIAAVLGADEATMDMTKIYLRIIMSFAPFYIMNHLIVTFLRNDGGPKLAAAALLISNFSNIVLDYVFIYLFRWGMSGAAFATALAPVISICVMSQHFLKKRNQFHMIRCRFSLRTILNCCRLGVSAMVNELSVGLVLMIFNFLFLELSGNTAVAAYGVVANVALFVVAVFNGIAQGIQPLVSDYYGRQIKGQLKVIRRDAAVLALALAVFFVILGFAFSGPVVAVFNSGKDPLLQQMAEEGLKMYFFGFLFSGLNIVFAGYLSAMERAAASFTISLMRGLAVIAPAAFLLSRILGVTGVWLSIPVSEAVTLAAGLVLMRRQSGFRA